MGLFSSVSILQQLASQTINQTNDTPPPAEEKRKPAKSKKQADKAQDAPPADTEKLKLNVEALKGMDVENLLQLRAELLEKIRRIAETCEGIENEANAQRVTELNGRQAELLAQKDELKAKLSALDGELGSIGKNIQDLSGSGLEKILQAIKNQRWFFFKNKPKVLMDRDTALLWPDLNYFPWFRNEEETYYPYSNSYAEVKGLISQTNSDSWGGFNDWEIPTPFELWKMIEDKTFPFQEGQNWRINGCHDWCVYYSNGLARKRLDNSGATSEISSADTVVIIPCSHSYVPDDYENNISPSNNFYTETEKLQNQCS